MNRYQGQLPHPGWWDPDRGGRPVGGHPTLVVGKRKPAKARCIPPARPAGAPGQQVTQARVVRSEWTKLRSLPSTIWSLLAALALIVGFGALYCVLRVTRPPAGPEAVAAFDPTAVSLTGVQLAQLAVGVLGVLLVAGEYATGTIRVSLAAVRGGCRCCAARPSCSR
jgi:hypothetical protein